jgi:hypothetical protein
MRVRQRIGAQERDSLRRRRQSPRSGPGGSAQEAREFSPSHPEVACFWPLTVPDTDVVAEGRELHALWARGVTMTALPPLGHRSSKIERIRSAEAR